MLPVYCPYPYYKGASRASYLVHALWNELALAVDAGEGPVPGHLLEGIRNVAWRWGAAIRGVGPWEDEENRITKSDHKASPLTLVSTQSVL